MVENSYAIITGASKGIGKAFAYELAAKKYNLVLVARSGALLQEIKTELEVKFSIQAYTLDMDLSLPLAANEIHRFCIEKQLSVSILINNAGYGLWGRFATLTLADQTNLLQLNITAIVQLTHLLLPLLHKNKVAHVLNVSSTAAYQAVPCLSIYAASKAFVLQFSRGLRYELRNTNVSVSCVSPGATSTGFIERAGMQALEKTAEKFSMTPSEVAHIAIDGMLKHKAEIIPGLVNKVSAGLGSILPKIWLEKAAASIYEKWLDKK